MAPQVRLAAHSSDYGPLILGLTWTEASIAIILLCGRFYTNWQITRRLRADFFIALFTFCVALIGQICLTIAVDFGQGQHIDTLSDDQAAKALEYAWVFQILFIICMVLGKLAIIAFLLQIRGPHDPKPWLLYFVAASQTLVMIVTLVLISQQCTPMSKLWDDRISGACDGKERNQKFGYFQGSWSALCDLILALYPISIIWKVRVDTHVKVGLCVLMGLGVIASICAAIRTAELQRLLTTTDITYALSPLIIWCATETWLILIVGCVPPIRPLFVQLFQAVSTATHSARSRSISRSGHSKAVDGTLSKSDQSDHRLRPIEQSDGLIASLGDDGDSHGDAHDVEDASRGRVALKVHDIRSQKVHITTRDDGSVERDL